MGRYSYILLAIIAAVVSGLIIYYMPKLSKEERFPFALILGGAIGNLIDRVFRGSVVDFIGFTFWPSFNIADTAISIAAVLLAYQYIRKK